MFLIVLSIIAGLVAIVSGAEFFVKGSSSLAKKLGVSDFAIGLTVVAIGTSTPELFVSIVSAIRGNGDLLLGNLLGSNISNILLILGASALVYPLTVRNRTLWKEIPFIFFLTALVGFLLNKNGYINNLDQAGGLVLVTFFAIFLYYVYTTSKSDAAEITNIKTEKWSLIATQIGGGLIGLTLGAKWLVSGAANLAETFRVTQSLVGITITAIGTSVPELATSITAALRRKRDIAIGNIIGSNVFNLSLILGLSAIIKPLNFSTNLLLDLYLSMGATALLFFAMFIGKKYTLEKWQGFVLIMLYLAYLAFVFLRG